MDNGMKTKYFKTLGWKHRVDHNFCLARKSFKDTALSGHKKG